MDFERDEAKRLSNILKHRIDFVDAIEVFGGRFIETEHRRRDYSEQRYRATGLLGDQVIQVVYTRRGERRRIISARRTGRMTEERITRVTLAQARRMKSKTDWARVDAMTEEEIERNAAEDPDNPPWTEEDWKNARVLWPQGKAPVTLRLDKDIIAWFKARGRGYQTRINAVLRAFVEAQKPRGWPPASGVSSEPRIRLNQRTKHQKAERQ
jgi:uncharacterized protein (DUF4415 family)